MTEKGKEATLFERRPDSAVLASSRDMDFWLNSQSAANNNFSYESQIHTAHRRRVKIVILHER